MEVREALDHLAEIRARMAHSTTFREFRARPVVFSASLALLSPFLQPLVVSTPLADLASYVAYWVAIAMISASAATIEMVLRARSKRSALTRQMFWFMVEQFTPAVLAGGLVTVAIVSAAPSFAWSLPALWSIFYSLGIFSCSRWLPRYCSIAAIYFLAIGTAYLLLGPDPHALGPWRMAIAFGIGQLLVAAALGYQTLHERISEAPGIAGPGSPDRGLDESEVHE